MVINSTSAEETSIQVLSPLSMVKAGAAAAAASAAAGAVSCAKGDDRR